MAGAGRPRVCVAQPREEQGRSVETAEPCFAAHRPTRPRGNSSATCASGGSSSGTPGGERVRSDLADEVGGAGCGLAVEAHLDEDAGRRDYMSANGFTLRYLNPESTAR